MLFKRELHEEGKRYREYLRALNEEEKRQEAELDKVIDAEVERLFKKRLSQWQAEREARKKLLEDVMAERKQQVDDKSNLNGVFRIFEFCLTLLSVYSSCVSK